MTSSVGGFDDWQGPALWRSSAWSEATIPLLANHFIEVFGIRGSSFASQYTEFTVTGNPVDITLESWRTINDVTPFTMAKWTLIQGMTLRVTVPVISNYITYGILCSNLGPTSVLMRSNRVNLGSDKIHYYGLNHQLATLGQSFPPLSSTTFVATDLLPGPATLWTNGPAAGSTLAMQISSLNRDAALVNRIGQINPIAGDQFTQLHIPDKLWVAVVTNTGAAAQTGSFCVTHRGHTT